MTIDWDYSRLAEAYADRPPYATQAVDAFVVIGGVGRGDRVCDIGAGTGHLTEPLVTRGLVVDAVEPNDAMRGIGVQRLRADPVNWFVGTGEHTGRPAGTYQMVTFGSSFNVTNRDDALREAHRLLVAAGWFVCLWNHRDLDDPLQQRIENVIRAHLPAYDLGSRRVDQREVITASGLFEQPVYLEVRQAHEVDRDSWVNGWRSHATLARQAGDRFDTVVADIEATLADGADTLTIPYTTRVWAARARTSRAD